MASLETILPRLRAALGATRTVRITGRVTESVGTIIRAAVAQARVGEICELRNPEDGTAILAEVVGFAAGAAVLTPLGDMCGIAPTTEVIPSGKAMTVPVGLALMGRVLDGLGRPLDEAERGPLVTTDRYPVLADAPHPLSRGVIRHPLPLGVRAMDGLLTCGEGQRLGVFAAAGGGKSTLMGMLVKGAAVDVNVIALIGERGREVGEFLHDELGPAMLARSVVVCATGDKSPMERSKAAFVATAVAEYFRDQGKRVLFLMDSVTRFARAQREIGLAAGEPPTRRGFPPSVFTSLPRLLERTGNNARGSITAFYTVLVEGDDMSEPIADEVRSILDGHVVLSRKLGAANHYPAIDVLASASRVMSRVAGDRHMAAAGRIRELMARYQDTELLLRMGEYTPGADPDTDEAIGKMPAINAFLRQRTTESQPYADTVAQLEQLAFGHASMGVRPAAGHPYANEEGTR
ncbi:type III secretion system ATPase SctN [Achromobacter aloeverae]|uniref:Type 3 secretion system ATPase n=1 Tax=Achromobacter aloeverae TaxID=1750518 RepID=A0A4Q1HLK4_9BURK|nr:type III secretion system ATPase SctN [Achromobacter aloeverae]RXN88195.1 EscN/YscN/HrcN family type III secretion system ATPase [Achromobacter aloeverae]